MTPDPAYPIRLWLHRLLIAGAAARGGGGWRGLGGRGAPAAVVPSSTPRPEPCEQGSAGPRAAAGAGQGRGLCRGAGAAVLGAGDTRRAEEIPFRANGGGADPQTLLPYRVQLDQFSRLNAAPRNVTCPLPGYSSGHVFQQLVNINCAWSMTAIALINDLVFRYAFLYWFEVPR